MDFGLIALGVVVFGKALDYIAPRTKTKVDDYARDVFDKVKGFLPFFNKGLAEKVNTVEDGADKVLDEVIPGAAENPPDPVTVTVMPDGSVVRDHRHQ